MFRKLIESHDLEVRRAWISDALLRARRRRAARGASAARWCSTAGDRIILDDDSMTSLEAKVDAARAGDGLQPGARAAALGSGLTAVHDHGPCVGPVSIRHHERAARRALTCGEERRPSAAWRCAP